MDLLRAQLDELMGKDRNLLPSQKSRNSQLHFSDKNVCKYFICGFCPHDLFTNTRSDLGSCPYVHDELCREEWEKYSKKSQYPYETEFYSYLERLICDLDRKIKRGLERLEHQNETPSGPFSKETEEKIDALRERIVVLLKQVETLGEEGRLEESQALLKLVDQLKTEEEQLKSGERAGQQEKRMKVCEVCGAFLVIGDTEKRVQSHLEGKQHLGFEKIRSALEEYRKRGFGKASSLDDRDHHDSDSEGRSRRRHRDYDREYDRDHRDRERGRRDRKRSRDEDSYSRERDRKR